MADIKVTYIDHLGNDLSVVNAARVSFGKHSDTLKPEDIKLIEYLAKNEHYSPFEHISCTVLIECPLYIRSQIHRHRTFAFNEVSRRYCSDNIAFYIPPIDDIRKQSTSNKQASDGTLDIEEAFDIRLAMAQQCQQALDVYNNMIAKGVAREQARSVLPMATMTQFYATANVRNWVHFLKLRLHLHAQKEARMVGEQALEILKDKFPESMRVLMADK